MGDDVTRPLLLDLFCGAGGAAMGYWRAGFDVVGVDINPQPNYPFRFIQSDAVELLTYGLSLIEKNWGHLDSYKHGSPYGRWTGFAAVHASPPCQRYSLMQRSNGDAAQNHLDLLPITRELLRSSRLPYVIENVIGAPMRSPLMLCGEMFGLEVIRHRLFESDMLLMQPNHPPHRGRVAGHRHGKLYAGPYFPVYGTGGAKGSLDEWRRAMGMDWAATKLEISEAIPPAYTEYIGTQLLEAVGAAA